MGRASSRASALAVACLFLSLVARAWGRDHVRHYTSRTVRRCHLHPGTWNEEENACNDCDPGFTLAEDGNCIPTCDEACADCGEDGKCELCKPGYLLFSSRKCFPYSAFHRPHPSNHPSGDYSQPDPDYTYGYGVHISGIFVLPCLVVIYILRSIKRARAHQMEFSRPIDPLNPNSGVSLPTMPPPPMHVADAEETENPTEQDRLLGDGGSEASRAPPGSMVLVIDPIGNIEMGKEEKANNEESHDGV